LVQILGVASQLCDEADVPRAAGIAVQVPYRVCPLGAHVDHQVHFQGSAAMAISELRDSGCACYERHATWTNTISYVQGGCISGMALDFGITLVIVPRPDRMVHMTSLNFAGSVAFSLDDAPPCRRGDSGIEENNWYAHQCNRCMPMSLYMAPSLSQDCNLYGYALQGQLPTGSSAGAAHPAAPVTCAYCMAGLCYVA
jgi:hypothetical protein